MVEDKGDRRSLHPNPAHDPVRGPFPPRGAAARGGCTLSQGTQPRTQRQVTSPHWGQETPSLGSRAGAQADFGVS